MPGAQIDDAEPAHADATTAIDINAFIVWPAVANQIAHGPDDGCLSPAFAQHEAGYSAHIGSRTEGMIGLNYPNTTYGCAITMPSTAGLGQIRVR
jgi:hypothetical protein